MYGIIGNSANLIGVISLIQICTSPIIGIGKSNEPIIGYCGLICTGCPAYLATKNDDNELRQKTAEEWSKMFSADIKSENINCDGCTTEGVKFAHCNECEMRSCGISRGVKNCGHCDDYACDKIEAFQKMVPDSKKVLDAEKSGT